MTSYEELLAFGLIELRLSRFDFDYLLPVELQACIKTWEKKNERISQNQYELERFGAWLSFPKECTQTQFFRFPWEKLQIAKVKYG